MLYGHSLTVDAADTQRLAEFWAAAMGYPPARGPKEGSDAVGLSVLERNDADSWRQLTDPDGKLPSIFFQRVPEPKTAKNRFHLDLDVAGTGTMEERRARIDAEGARLIALGASNHRGATDEGESYWLRMNDPEGNEFCLV